MAEDRRTFMIVGLSMAGAGVLFALLGGISDAAFGPLAGLSGTLVFFGIVILVIAAFRGTGSSQQQQQQVVVVNGGGSSAPSPASKSEPKAAVRCPDCSTLNPVRASFCGHCGHRLGSKQAANAGGK